MTTKRTFTVIEDLDLLLEHGDLFRPSSWQDLLKNLPHGWKKTHYIFSVGTLYIEALDNFKPTVGMLVETEEDFNLDFLLGHVFFVIEIEKVKDAISTIDNVSKRDPIFSTILTFPFYKPTSSNHFKSCLPLNWEDSYEIYVIAGYQNEKGTFIQKPTLIEDWTDIKLYMIYDDEFFILVPKIRASEFNRIIKAYEEQEEIQVIPKRDDYVN